MHSQTRVMLVLSFAAMSGCNTFTEPLPYEGDAGSSVRDTGDRPDAGQAGDSGEGLDATPDANSDANLDGGGSGAPTAIIETSCDAELREGSLQNGSTGELRADISVLPVTSAGTNEFWVTYLEEFSDVPSDARLLRVSVDLVSETFSLVEAGDTSLESLVTQDLTDFASSGASISIGAGTGDLRWAISGATCPETGNGAGQPVVWYGELDPDVTVGDIASLAGDCGAGASFPNYWSPQHVGGFSPLVGEVEVPTRLTMVGSTGMATVGQGGTVEEVEWETRPASDVASGSPTAGTLVMTLNAGSTPYVWDPVAGLAPVPIPDRFEGFDFIDAIGLNGDLIYLGDDRYLFAFWRFGEVWIDIFEWDSVASTFTFVESVDRIPAEEVYAVDLAPFEGGWALGWLKREKTGFDHTIVPYSWDGTQARRSACRSSSPVTEGGVADYELAAFRSGTSLVVLSTANHSVPRLRGRHELDPFGAALVDFF